MKEIIRLQVDNEFDLVHLSIYGLNIFEHNELSVSPDEDPRLSFLSLISKAYPCSACVGYLSLKDHTDNPIDLFGPPEGKTPYIRVPIGLYGGTFYDLVTYPTEPACFFPIIGNDFWKAKVTGDQADLTTIIYDDALAVYVGTDLGSQQKIAKASSEPFVGEADWLQLLSQLCSVIILSAGDGMSVEVFTKDLTHLDLLYSALDETTAKISQSDWYKTHRDDLAWNFDDMCLNYTSNLPLDSVT